MKRCARTEDGSVHVREEWRKAGKQESRRARRQICRPVTAERARRGELGSRERQAWTLRGFARADVSGPGSIGPSGQEWGRAPLPGRAQSCSPAEYTRWPANTLPYRLSRQARALSLRDRVAPNLSFRTDRHRGPIDRAAEETRGPVREETRTSGCMRPTRGS
ncbi:hypothetical protein KM043_000311 [Ampulex compressa]|nr:hypothetical protein KM043_000311 [Ampulex compressa]